MSDELAIQPQIIEPRKKDNSLAYGATGAIVGAGGGYLVDRYVLPKGAKNLSDLAADATSKDKVELSSKYADIESASIDDLKAKAQALKDAEAKLAEASKAVADPNNADVKAFQEAERAKQAELDRLISQETTRLGGSGTTANYDIRKPDFKPSTAYGSAELLEPGKSDNWHQRIKAANKYDELTKAVRDASNNIETRLNSGSGVGARRTAMLNLTPYTPTAGSSRTINTVADLFESFNDEYKIATDAEKAEMFNKTRVVSGATVTTPAYNRAYNLAKTLHNDPVILTNPNTQFEHYLKFGEFVEGGKKPIKPLDGQVFPMNYTDATGHHRGWITYSDSAKKEYEAELKSTVEARRVQTAEQFLANAEQYAQLTEQRKPAELVKSIQAQFSAPEYLEGLGANGTTRLCDSTNWIKVNEIVNASGLNANSTTIKVDGKKVRVTGYEHDIAKLKKAGNKMPSSLNGVYKKVDPNDATKLINVTDPKEALEMAKKRQEIFKAYHDLEETLVKQMEECKTANAFIEELDAKIAKAYNEDKALTEARKKLAERFPKIFSEDASTGVSSEIEAKAKEFAEKNIDKKFQAEIDRLKPAYDEAAKSGKVDEAAKKAAEEAKNKAKTEFDNAVKNITEKYGKGRNKWLAPVIGGVALAAAGWFAGHSDEA